MNRGYGQKLPEACLLVSQGITLLLVGPFVDKLVTDHWVLDYRFTTGE